MQLHEHNSSGWGANLWLILGDFMCQNNGCAFDDAANVLLF
jgi:hypothetical protein